MNELLVNAKEKGYLVVNNSSKTIEVSDKFITYCENYKKPYIVVRTKAKWCSVVVDTITMDMEFKSRPEHCLNYVKEIRELIDEAHARGHLNTKELRCIGGFTQIYVLKELGEYYAQRIIEIIYG